MRHLTFFFRLFGWFSIRHILKNPWRALAVLLGIALGAAVFTSVRLSVQASLDSFTNSVNLVTGRADQTLIRPGGMVPETLVADLLKHPAVETASPVLSAYVAPRDNDASPFLLIGFDPILDRPVRDWETEGTENDESRVWFRLLSEPYAFIAGDRLIRENRWRIDDAVSLRHSRRDAEFRLAGSLSPEGLALAEGGMIAVTDIATFQEFTGAYGAVDRIDLVFQPGTTDQDIASVRQLLPEGVIMAAPSENRESGEGMIRAYQLNLTVLSFASLFVGMFLVYSLIALNAASRRGELAILRSMGAHPGMLFMLFLSEGAAFGVSGWLIAIPLGALLTTYLLGGVSDTISTLFVRVRVDRLSLSGWEIGLSFIATLVIAVTAALQPARDAMKVSPKEAFVIAQHGGGQRGSTGKITVLGLISLALVWPLSRIPGVDGVPISGYLAIFCLFVGFSLIAPWGLRRIGHAAAPFFMRISSIPGYLAARFMRDSGIRTAISVGALITAVALFAALVIMIHSFRNTVSLWVNQTVSGDLFVSAKLAEINRFRDPMPEAAVDGLKSLDAPADLVPNRRYFIQYAGFPCQIELMEFEPFLKHGRFFWMNGDPETAMPDVIAGKGVLISEVLANRTGLSVGDRFQARADVITFDLPVRGIIRDYRTRGGVVFAALPPVERQYGDIGWTGVRLFFKSPPEDGDAALTALRAEVIRKCGPRLEMVNGNALRRSVMEIFDETFAVTTVLLLIALAVAALGVATTLTVLVLERSRQLNAIIAVGGDPGQVRSMIFWEAALMGTAGEFAGLGCGFILSWLLIYVINRQSFGWTFMYQIDWFSLLASFPLILAAALAAAMPAVRLAFREPPAAILRSR